MLEALLLTTLMGLDREAPAEGKARVLRNRPLITQAVYHPDGKRVYCVTTAGLEAYDTATGKLLFDSPYGRHLVCSPNGAKLALVATTTGMVHIGGTVVVLDGDTGKKLHQLSGTFATFSPDGRWLITHTGFAIGHPKTDLPPKVQITDLTSGKMHLATLKNLDEPIKGFGAHTAPRHFRFSRDGKVLVGAARSKLGQWKSLSACDLATGKPLQTIPKDEDLQRVPDPQYSGDGKRFVADWQVFDAERGAQIAKFDIPKHLAEHSWYPELQLSSDGKNVFSVSGLRQTHVEKDRRLTVSRASQLHVWDAETGAWKKTLAEAKSVHVLPAVTSKKLGNAYRADPRFIVNPQGTSAISHAADGTLTVWDLSSGKRVRTLRAAGHSTRPEILTFSADGRWLASGSSEGEVVLWDAKTGQAMRAMGQAAHLSSLCFRPQSRELVGVGNDLIYVWNFETGELVRTFERKGNMFRVACHPDGKLVAVVDYWNNATFIVDIDTGKTPMSLSGTYQSMAFHPDGKSLLTLDSSGAASLWNLQTGKKLQRWFGGRTQARYRAQQVIFSADGATFLLRENYNTISKVDAATGKRLVEHIIKHKSGARVEHVSLHPDGTRFAVGYHGEQDVEERDFATGEVRRTFSGHAPLTARVLYTPDGTHLATTGQYDFVIRVHAVPRTP